MRTRVWVVTAVVVVVVIGGLAGAALLAWPHVRLGPAGDALARVVLPGLAGRVAAVDVRSAAGGRVPVQLRQGKLWPLRQLAAGERLTVELTVRRPGWAGWLVGGSERRSFTVVTPSAHLLGRWLQVKAGTPVKVAFDAPVERVSLAGSSARPLPTPQAVVGVGVVARGSHSAGAIEVAAAARSWESLPTPVRVSWFTAQPYPQLLVEPRPAATLAPTGQLTLTFSGSIPDVLGAGRPRLSPATPGRWRALDAHTLTFQPSGLGFGLGETLRVELPRAVHLAGQTGVRLTRTLQWRVSQGSTLRLQQLLAQLGYLPLDWQSAADPAPASLRAQLAAALSPPPGRFSWRYANTPADLRALWHVGRSNEITRGAVMIFEDTHGLAVDGLTGPKVWSALIGDAIAGRRRSGGYSYVYVHRTLPQSLNLWHNGRVILSSPGNTGVPAAPTQLGTFPVFEHIVVGTMSGTNPDGSHYNDPGIRYISYFHGGEAIHAFNRASFGTPQSLGCVELPLAAAAKVWPYTPIGTLVTIEN
jgi:peptidoglycan hydrolase-like protein with peptidoglycan-binding domain